MSDKVTVKSPEGDEAQVFRSQVEALETSGWTVVDDGSSESGQAAPEGAVEGQDPGL